MSWSWGNLSFGSNSARRAIEAGLEPEKHEPVLPVAGETAEMAAEMRASLPAPVASIAPSAPPVATLPATASVEDARAPAAIPSGGVWRARPTESVVAAQSSIGGAEALAPTKVTVPVKLAEPLVSLESGGEAANTLDGLDEIPQAPVDYLAMGRTSNTFGHAARFPADDHRQPTWAQQRVERGFDDTELWNLDDTIARFVLPRLKALRKNAQIPPTAMPLGHWHLLLDKMVVAFELLLPPGGGSWDRGKLSNSQRSQVQEGLDLFRRYFFALAC